MTSTSLPSFHEPPVTETALSLQFAPIQGWTLGHFGMFWERVRATLPRIESHPPLSDEIEDPDSLKPASPHISLIRVPELRCWYMSGDQRQIVQLQRNRFVYNWRSMTTDDVYPRYDAFVRPTFLEYWQEFSSFSAAEGFPSLAVVQCEVTYVNTIPQGVGWTTPAEWSSVFNLLTPPAANRFLPGPDSGQFGFSYPISDRRGRLHIAANHAIASKDGSEAIKLQLTARGKPSSSDLNDILDWIDTGREWVVRGFADITTEKVHQQWGID